MRFLSAVVDDAPAALLTIDEDERVTLLNKAARRQFVDRGVRVADFPLYGADPSRRSAPSLGRRVTQLIRDGVTQRVIIETARIERLGSNLRIVSILPVQNVLGAAEMAAQSGLVRVLTHEIMNSLTPVTSLVRSAAESWATAERIPKLSPKRARRSKSPPAAQKACTVSSKISARSRACRKFAAAVLPPSHGRPKSRDYAPRIR